MSDEDRMRFETDELYVKLPEEMSEYFAAFPDAIENTVKIAGVISSVKKKYTKNNKIMVFLTIEEIIGKENCIV